MAHYKIEIPLDFGKERKEELFYLSCYYFPKLKNHVLKCKTFEKERTSHHEIDCEICNKILCFLDLMYKFEIKKSKINIEHLEKSGIMDHMIFGNGIKLLE